MHSGFNKKITTQVLDVISLSQHNLRFFIRRSFKIYYRISGPHISYWSMVGWSVVDALGRWSVVGAM